jgi:hypothetical protein
MVLLEATSLKSMSGFYNSLDYSVLESKIQEALTEISNYYSELTVKTISLMLTYDLTSRMDPI